MMRKILFTLTLLVSGLCLNAQLNEVVTELIYSDDGTISGYPTGCSTYRIYALLENPSDFMSSVYAVGDDVLTIETSTNSIWNSGFGGITADDIPAAFFGFVPSLEFDSFITIGKTNDIDPGGIISVIESLPGSALAEGFGTMGSDEFDTNITLLDGAWFALNGDVNGLGVGEDNRVLLAQITTNGTLSFCFNLQVFLLGDGLDTELYTNVCGGGSLDGCIDTTACNYNELASEDDGSCCYGVCGCTDSDAENYDSNADCNDGTCLYSGCTDFLACNFDINADIDDDSCDYSCLGCLDSTACNFDPQATENDFSCDFSCLGCTDSSACNFDSDATMDDGLCEYFSCADDHCGMNITYCYGNNENTTFTFHNDSGSSNNIGISFQSGSVESSSFDQFTVYNGSDNTSPILYANGNGTTDLSNMEWWASGLDITIEILTDGSISCATGGNIDSWNFDILCDDISMGCTDNAADNYNSEAEYDDGSCLYSGCTDWTACNFDAQSNVDDGSCILPDGCNDPEADNYDSTALCNDDSCEYSGCINPFACNFDWQANVDDGSCILPDGCTDIEADNYDSEALCNDNTCEYSGCTDSLAFNFDPQANIDDGSCSYDCNSNFLSIDMLDSFGDGWNGAFWTILDDDQNFMATGTLATGSVGSSAICLEDGCYTITVQGGTFDSEISWELNGTNAGTISGFAPMEQCFSIGDVNCFNGCTNPVACNYDSSATCDDQSCILPGCMDSTACNYDSETTCSSGSCLYEAIIEGIVFNDADQNGNYSGSGFDEPGLFNWQVEIVELGLSTYTNGDGFYQFFNVPSGTYILSITNIAEGWASTSQVEVSVSTSSCLVENVNFGFAAEGTSPFWLSGPCCIWSMNIHCENGFNPGLWINNTGSAPLYGSVTITFDPILEAEALFGAVSPSDISAGSVTWELDGIPVGGQSLLFQCHIIGPGFEYMGDQFDISINLALEDEGVEYYNNTWVLEPIVVCSYDPNDKYAAYEGYTEEHFILPDNSIEYRIRFQNTGNWEAEDIVVTDMIDIERLDMETFQPMFGSHSYMTCVQPDGQVDFVFEDIFLPDSASNEPASQGYVVYRITPMEGIEPGEVINNTANIYFDNNPAIVTNTTWHTIMDCEPISDFTVSSDQLCLGDVLTLETTSNYADVVNWFVNDEMIGDGNMIDYTAQETGSYQIDVEVANPLCSEESFQGVIVNPLPEASFTEDGVLLTASSGTSYQWYLNGNPISGATLQTYQVMETGTYSVEVTNEFNCSDHSDEIMVIVNSMDDLNNISLSIYPNPITETATLFFGENGGAYNVQIISISGQLVRSFDNITDNKLILNRENIATGTYVLNVIDRTTSLTRELKIIFE